MALDQYVIGGFVLTEERELHGAVVIVTCTRCMERRTISSETKCTLAQVGAIAHFVSDHQHLDALKPRRS